MYLPAGHKGAVLELHWTTDGERIASASPDKSVRVWDAATGSQVSTVPLACHMPLEDAEVAFVRPQNRWVECRHRRR